jgi:hypothetical protein
LDRAEALLELSHLVCCVALFGLLGGQLALELALDLLVLVAARLRCQRLSQRAVQLGLDSIKALLRLYYGTIKALVRLRQGVP